MLLNELDHIIVTKILNKEYKSVEKSSSLKKVASLLNKIKSSACNLDSLLIEFGGIDVSKFQSDLIEILLSDLKLTDVPKLFVIFLYLSEEYIGFQEYFFNKTFDLINDNSTDLQKLKIFSKFLIICFDYDKCTFQLLDRLLNYTLSIPYNDLNNFLTFFVKISSLSQFNEKLKSILAEKFENVRVCLLSDIKSISKRTGSLASKMKFIYENKGDLSQPIIDEFLQNIEKFETEKSLFLKLGGTENEIPCIDSADLLIDSDRKIKFTNSLPQFSFESKEEENFYILFDQANENKTVLQYLDEENLINILLSINSVEDSDLVFTTLKDHIKSNSPLILNSILKCCKLSNQRIPLLCRLMAYFSRFDDIFKSELNNLILTQLNSLLRVKGSVSGLRFRICTVVCELVKFRVIDVGSLYRFLFICAESLSYNSIEMICIIMENCGRILSSMTNDKRFLNLIKTLHSKAESDDKPNNFYKIVHILSFFEGADNKTVDHNEVFEKFSFIVKKLKDGSFLNSSSLVVYDALFFICRHINLFTNFDLELINPYLNSSSDSIFYLLLEVIDDHLHYSLQISDLKTYFSLCLFLHSICISLFPASIILEVFTEILNNFLGFNESSNEFLTIFIEELSIYFSECPSDVKNKWFSLCSKIFIKDNSPEDKVPTNHLNSFQNDEFDILLSSTIKGELSHCLSRRPLRKGFKIKLDNSSPRDNTNLIIITQKHKNQ